MQNVVEDELFMDVSRSGTKTRMRGTAFTLGIAGLIGAVVCLRFATPALAASVTTVSNDDTGARVLAESMMRDAGQLRGASFATVPPSGTPRVTTFFF